MYVPVKSVTFVTWEVRALLEGRKTEFRRVVEPDVSYWVPGENYYVREGFARGLKDKLYYRADPSEGRLVHGGWLGAPNMHYAESRMTIQATFVRQEGIQEAPGSFWRAEGVDPDVFKYRGCSLLDWWTDTWDRTHPKGQRWVDNPRVWVIGCKMV